MAKKDEEERDLRRALDGKPDLKEKYGDGWTTIADIMKKAGATSPSSFYSNIRRSQAHLPSLALSIVQYVAEIAKPDAERLPRLSRVPARVATVRAALLRAGVSASWTARSWDRGSRRGGKLSRPTVRTIKIVLNGRQPEEVARELISWHHARGSRRAQDADGRRPESARSVNHRLIAFRES